jgi:hypothetical protein
MKAPPNSEGLTILSGNKTLARFEAFDFRTRSLSRDHISVFLLEIHQPIGQWATAVIDEKNISICSREVSDEMKK